MKKPGAPLSESMNGAGTTADHRRSKGTPGLTNVAIYCAFFSVLFVLISILVEIPISTMMISEPRKIFGNLVFVSSISFFAIFSFKTSRSRICLLPFTFVLVFVACPVLLLTQESRHLFNYADSAEEVLPYCSKGTKHLPQKQAGKYVVFRPTNTGTGNRILALVSCYALALVTGRELLVDWQTTAVFGAQFESLFRSEHLKPLADVIGNGTMTEEDYHFLNLVYCRQCSLRRRHEGYSDIASKDLIASYPRKFLIVRSNVYFAPALFANKVHRAALCSIANATELFHTLFKKLLDLSPELQEALEKKLATFEGRDVVGIQIRLKDRVGFPSKRVGHFFNCAMFLASKYNRSLIFIASDSETLKKQAQAVFRDRLYQSKERTRQFSEEGIKSAILDLIMLSRCRELVLTPFSTFGAVAAGIGNVVPHFVTRDEGYCVRDLASEPKFHYWHALSLYREHGTGSSDMLNQDDSFL
jgi:hypothetical protein